MKAGGVLNQPTGQLVLAAATVNDALLKRSLHLIDLHALLARPVCANWQAPWQVRLK